MKQNHANPVIEIQTPRLILRPPKISDMSSIKESIDASMNDIAPWLEWATSTFTIFYSCFDINKLPNDKINWLTKNSNLKSR